MHTSSAPRWQRALIILTTVTVGAIIISCLYWAQVVLIPLALALFLTFVLRTPVQTLQRWRLGRIPSVALVVFLASLFLGCIGWVVTRQISSLLAELPAYTETIKARIQLLQDLGNSVGGPEFEQMLRELSSTWKPEGRPEVGPPSAAAPGPAPTVVIESEIPLWITRIRTWATPLMETLMQAGLAMVLTIFMLLKREHLRDRFIRLVGRGHLTATTKAVDDASQRISRYLLAQCALNCCFGLAVGLGLWVLGVRYAFMWGFLGGLLRYLPYIGSPLAALFPTLLSLAQSEGWATPLLVIGWILLLELITANLLEPRVYGQSIGVSEVAMLLAAAFWAFLWGPIGLVLSGPLTVCLVVLGRHVPQLEFFDVLLGNGPALEPDVGLYQRLIAMDQDEAVQIVETYLQKGSPDKIFDDLLIPALVSAKTDRERGNLAEEDAEYVLQAMNDLVEDIVDPGNPLPDATAESETPSREDMPSRIPVLAIPARDHWDEIALRMLLPMLSQEHWDLKLAGMELLSSELLTLVEARKPAVICIGSLPPSGLAHTRYLCKRLRRRFPRIKLVVGRWGLKNNLHENQDQLLSAGANLVTVSLEETRAQLQAWLPVLEQARLGGPHRLALRPHSA